MQRNNQLTCGWINLARRIDLSLSANKLISGQTPTQSPFKKTLCIWLNDDRDISSSFSIPHAINLSKMGSIILELTTAVTAKFLTRPQFSPSGVDKKHNLPQ